MNTDSRLAKAYEWIGSGKVKVLSLDVFDTLLWRKVPHYEDLFLLLGKRLKAEGWLIPAVTPESFVDLRVEGEMQAREAKQFPDGRTEVTLPEIYWHLQRIFVALSVDQMIAGNVKGIYEGDVSPLVHMEVALEKELVQRDASIVRLIQYARERHVPVVLVSDTYFEESYLQELISNIPGIHRLFLSCEYGCGKKEGLFKYVVEQMGIAPAKILHIGDNYESDVLAGNEMGFKTLYYPKADPELEEILEREWQNRGDLLDSGQGDFGLTALRGKIIHHTDLDSLKGENRFYWKYGAMVLGPILLGFVHWVYERCCAMGQKEVFCLMREGKLYAKLIERFAPYYPQHAIEAKQLWVSRSFMTQASITTASRKELFAVMKTFLEHLTVETFCTHLGLDIGKMGKKWSSYQHVMLEDPALRQELIFDLLGNESWRKQIVNHASGKRERFLKYLSEMISWSKNEQMTVVDIGWGGTAQEAMQNIFNLAGVSKRLHGLYLGTTEVIHEGLLQGIIREGYLFSGGYPYTGNAYKKGCFVLEQCATAETGVGSLADIDEEGKVVTHPVQIDDKQKKQAETVQQGIFAFFDFVSPYIQSGAVKLDSHSEALHHQLRAIFLRSMTNATQNEAVKFGAWRHEHGPTRHLTQVIGKNPYYDTFFPDMIPTAAFKESGLNWLSAYAAKQSKYLTLATQAVWLDTLPARCFLSEDHYPCKVFIDTGRDFPKQPQQKVSLRSNPNRRFYTVTRLFSSKKGMKRIQLMLSFPESLVRIISLRMVVYEKQKPDFQEIAFFEEGDQPHEIVCLAGQKVDRNTFYCKDHLQLLHAFQPSDVYHVRLKLCCEMFPLNEEESSLNKSRSM